MRNYDSYTPEINYGEETVVQENNQEDKSRKSGQKNLRRRRPVKKDAEKSNKDKIGKSPFTH